MLRSSSSNCCYSQFFLSSLLVVSFYMYNVYGSQLMALLAPLVHIYLDFSVSFSHSRLSWSLEMNSVFSLFSFEFLFRFPVGTIIYCVRDLIVNKILVHGFFYVFHFYIWWVAAALCAHRQQDIWEKAEIHKSKKKAKSLKEQQQCQLFYMPR